MCNKLITT